ncbi:MAG: sulfotransferase domain-containing protein [Gemmatimonadetes bacterium]|nr:sulfotransferase domain-containing protein [Gemmatimonadota bacterium]
MGVLSIVGLIVAALILLLVAQSVHLSSVLKWEDHASRGLGYYGLSLADRRRFKAKLRRQALLLTPILRLSGWTSTMDFRKASHRTRGVAGPLGTTSPASFESAAAYQPRAQDVFVVTQMKCGTTWMQHLVYQIAMRGNGDLVETGTALYAIAPWLEGIRSVPVDQAPTVGTQRPTRIIKTHLPAGLCPFGDQARYVYVARHPVSCFASCLDFIETNVGALAPPVAASEAWYTSPELMWWGTWPDHVRGWWDLARQRPNVLFVYFEDMKKDLGAVARQVADFLGVRSLSEPELARVIEKCSFKYMQEHQDMFEMHPPHVLQTNAALFVKGSADRHQDVPVDVRRRIGAWCVDAMRDSDFPLAERYPDLTRT